ncbi:hypothetical protein Droror1_Dr00018198 [Drosera rotundifolia]
MSLWRVGVMVWRTGWFGLGRLGVEWIWVEVWCGEFGFSSCVVDLDIKENYKNCTRDGWVVVLLAVFDIVYEICEGSSLVVCLLLEAGDFEWFIHKYEIIPKSSTSKDYMQLDLGQLQVRNEFVWHGSPKMTHLLFILTCCVLRSLESTWL